MCLLYARHCVRCFLCIISFKTHILLRLICSMRELSFREIISLRHTVPCFCTYCTASFNPDTALESASRVFTDITSFQSSLQPVRWVVSSHLTCQNTAPLGLNFMPPFLQRSGADSESGAWGRVLCTSCATDGI